MEPNQNIPPSQPPPPVIMPKQSWSPAITRGAAILVLLVVLGFGYVIYTRSGFDFAAWFTSVTAPKEEDAQTPEGLDAIDPAAVLKREPQPNAPELEKQAFSQAITIAGTTTDAIIISSGCTVNPYIAQMYPGAIKVKNADKVPHTLIMSIGSYTVKAGETKTLAGDFKQKTAYGFRCDNGYNTAGIIHVVE